MKIKNVWSQTLGLGDCPRPFFPGQYVRLEPGEEIVVYNDDYQKSDYIWRAKNEGKLIVTGLEEPRPGMNPNIETMINYLQTEGIDWIVLKSGTKNFKVKTVDVVGGKAVLEIEEV